ncbi:MAG TPA: sialate O-acetylesterase [Pirellulaceae bacterium]|nr:sialate O-acetylesterase [Pirellulaceae bacterium]
MLMLPRLNFVLLLALLSSAPSVRAAANDASPAWRAIRTVAAPEAHQAAAADANFFYAITNSAVAKYDRLSGEKIAVSTGEAKHLNSGFFGNGRLYCAHSNYPQTPEISEIKVLNVETMQLTTFKDFGNFGGSLTWALWHDGHWWCNFAKYGERNAETFLVKFDPQWNEKQRFTYPMEVLQHLGRNSLSGGIWQHSELLVTGHDDPVLFRLALPKEGTVLKLLRQEAIPFTGQGFAIDPKTNGLIGIQRAKRQMVVAARPDGKPLRLPKIFNDHMVLQRGDRTSIWGWARPAAMITIEFAGQTIVTKADADGAWQALFKTLAADATGRDLTVQSEGESLVVRDVVVGEVWHASGQSNMAMTVGQVAERLVDVKTQVTQANLPAVRFCRSQQGDSVEPLTELASNSEWIVSTPGTTPAFSAAAFFFARKLHQELQIPIGVIDSSRGGTPIEPFIPRDAFESHPTLRKELELGDQHDLAGLTKLVGGVYARDANWLPARLFNSRIAPIARFHVAGLVWYQGESNCGHAEDPRDYQHKMRALVSGWRAALHNEQLPVYFVQLPGSGAGPGWPYLREQQRLSSELTHTGMVVTIDLLDGDIHPPNKVDVGERLAQWALANRYSRKMPYSGPMFTKAEIHDGKVVTHFEHSDSGLMIAIKTGLAAAQESAAVKLGAFELADAAGKWSPAEASIVGETVVVTSKDVAKPVAVRYGYQVSPTDCHLYNRAGLPAAPFCSHPELLRYEPQRP